MLNHYFNKLIREEATRAAGGGGQKWNIVIIGIVLKKRVSLVNLVVLPSTVVQNINQPHGFILNMSVKNLP
jgi:hypothetical protein